LRGTGAWPDVADDLAAEALHGGTPDAGAGPAIELF